MRKLTALILVMLCIFVLAGCSASGISFDIGTADRIELRSGNDGNMIKVTEPDDIKHITDNINSLSFSKAGSSKDYGGWSYSLKWYDSENKIMEEITVMSEYQIDYKNYFYKSVTADCGIDIAFFDTLLALGTPENEDQTDGSLGKDAADNPSHADTITDVCPPDLSLLTLKDLVARDGENLTWDDFSSYYSEEIGSGLYILRYPVGMDYYLLIGGGDLNSPPMYIRLVSEYDSELYIDVRTESIDDFISNAPKTGVFSYEEVLETYKENDPGVKYDDFANTNRVALERIYDVIERAKNECTIAYTTIDVSYDSTSYMWAVLFWSGTPGGGQTVYMDLNGVTCLIVYGE